MGFLIRVIFWEGEIEMFYWGEMCDIVLIEIEVRGWGKGVVIKVGWVGMDVYKKSWGSYILRGVMY